MATIHNLLAQAEIILTQAAISSPRTDAEWLLAFVLNCTRSDLHIRASKSLSSKQAELFQDLIHQRAHRIPLQHLTKQTEFYGLPFYSSPKALIPRPETETLIETILKHAPSQSKILDIGTGSGIIAITLAHELPKAHVIATDVSYSALCLAKKNANLNGVINRIDFIRTDLLSSLTQSFDVIASNPPYIPTSDIDNLEPEVRDHDPILALDGGSDGLNLYRQIIPQSVNHLAPHGILAFEIGHDQADAVSKLLSKQPRLTQITLHRDLSGHTRVICAQKQS